MCDKLAAVRIALILMSVLLSVHCVPRKHTKMCKGNFEGSEKTCSERRKRLVKRNRVIVVVFHTEKLICDSSVGGLCSVTALWVGYVV